MSQSTASPGVAARMGNGTHPKIDIAAISVKYGDTTVVKDLSIQVNAGEVLSVIGGSGCGKTTLLHVVAGLVPSAEGHVYVDGTIIDGPGRDRVMVFQDDAVFPWMTVRRNVEYGLRTTAMDREARDEVVDRILAMVGLKGRGHLLPRQLSGGMRKRVDVARALAVEPQILLMDEPYASLDAMTKERLQDEFMRIHSRARMTVLFVTHDLEEALFVGDRVAIMGTSPGHLSSLLDVPLTRPRAPEIKRSLEFQALRGELDARLQAAGVELRAASETSGEGSMP